MNPSYFGPPFIGKSPGSCFNHWTPDNPLLCQMASLLLVSFAAIVAGASGTLFQRGPGGVSIYNNCNTTIYSWTVTQVGNESSSISPGEWYWEPYQYPSDGGTSIKMSRNDWDAQGPITQLEYTMSNDLIYYDLSNVNCGRNGQESRETCPFLIGGMFLASDHDGCPTVTCENEIVECLEVYNLPDDDRLPSRSLVHTCDATSKLIFYMCSSQAIC